LSLTILILRIQIQITKEQIIFLALSGFIGLVIGDSFLFMAFNKIGPRITMLVMALNPAMAAGFAYIFLGEGIPVYGIIGILITLIGILIVLYEKPVLSELSLSLFPDDNKISNKKNTTSKVLNIGLLFAVFGALGQAISLIFIKRAFVIGHIDGFIATNVRILSSLIIFIPFGIIFKKFLNPVALFYKDKRTFSLVVLGSVIGPYLGITFSLIAVSNTKELGIAATLMATIPIMMLPLSYFIYKEKLNRKSIIGTVLAVCGVAILFLRS
jgi:drug/metabolite transporter (DMT)-like permease